jgi:membrane protein
VAGGGQRVKRFLATFYRKAYEDNITGQSGMVAYNLLASVFPLALLALFIAGRLLRSPDLEQSVLNDLSRLFPTATDATLGRALHNVQNYSTSFGVVALVSSLWIGSSFWGALDTAFCRIYHVRCRGWVEQKRFALAMLLVVLLFMAATVAVPALQSLMLSTARDLPFGLSKVRELVYAASLVAGLVVLFVILCVIYWTVPNTALPWQAVWPGAAAATVAIAIVDYAFPAYLGHVSTIAKVGTTFVFVLIVLVWFYVLAIVILGGAIVNAMRFELHDTGEIAAEAEPG